MSGETGETKLKQHVHQFMLEYKGLPGEATYNATVYDCGSLVEALRDEMAARRKGSGTANPRPPNALAKADRA